MRSANLSFAWAAALLDELVAAGVRHVVVSPGSRSAPLALCAVSDSRLRVHVLLDERGSGYFALGLARSARTTVALVCTSGTAVAGWLPAAIEASHLELPLLLLSADRPPELRDCDAGQTIAQPGLFGRFVREACELPVPEASERAFRRARAQIARLVEAARAPRPGPVHVNVPLREPLDPGEVAAEQRVLEGLSPVARSGRADGAALTRTSTATGPALAERDLAELASALRRVERGWIVAGPLDASPHDAQAIAALARALDWPLFAEPLAQLRSAPDLDRHTVAASGPLLRSGLPDALPPACVLRFGRMPTSKAFRSFAERHPECRQISVDPFGWSDPGGVVEQIVRAEPVPLARALSERLEAPAAPTSAWTARWLAAGRRAQAAVQRVLADAAPSLEPGVAPALAAALPDGALAHLASSLPVRDADDFWPASPRALRFVANRGTNGIDGTLACALGAAAGHPGPTLLWCGDLALLHDASSLAAAARSAARLSVVVVDNDGGGIFEQLPAARSTPRAHFERVLATPHGLDLAAVVRGYGLRCAEPEDAGALEAWLAGACERPGCDVAIVRSDRRASRALRQAVAEAVAKAVATETVDA